MKATVLWPLTILTLGLSACSGDVADSASDEGSDSGDSVPTMVPSEGDWTFGSGTWVSDECQASFLSTPIGWTLSDSSETGFDLSFQFQESGSLVAAPACTLSSGDFVCESVVQQFSVGGGSITLEANAEGTFSSDITASLEVSFDIDCSGGSCGSMLAANPCTSVQSFNAFYDG
jgi:hypothetical protein